MLKDRVIVSVRGERGEERGARRGARGEGRRIYPTITLIILLSSDAHTTRYHLVVPELSACVVPWLWICYS